MPTPISRTDAIERVTLLSDASSFPTVAGAIVGAYVDDAARPDADGNAITADDWTPTYDLNAAIASVYETKAALVAARYDTDTDGQALQRSQMLAHMRAMSKMYRDRIASTMRKPKMEPLPDREPS